MGTYGSGFISSIFRWHKMDYSCTISSFPHGSIFLFHHSFSKSIPNSLVLPHKKFYLNSCPRLSSQSSLSIQPPTSYGEDNHCANNDMLIAFDSSLNGLIVELSDEASPSSLSRACAIIHKLQKEGKMGLLDSNSLGHLAIAAAKTGSPRYGETIIRSMLHLGVVPHVKAWSAVVSQLGKHPKDSPLAFRLFHDICEHLRAVDKMGLGKNTKPDTGAFNAILNVCAIGGDMVKAEDLIRDMCLFGVSPDVLTYNILIKLYGKVRREDLLVSVVQKMLEENLEPCISTFYSIVEAYVGFGDLDKAEMLVQAMREGRRDICNIFRQDNGARHGDRVQNLLLPRSYKPDHRIYTALMKGYMQNKRLRDVIKLLRAMQDEDDSESHPNEVTYTTAISALVKMGSMGEAHAVLREMAAKKVPMNVITYNSLLNGYCRQKDMQKAKALMQEMEEAGIVPDVVSYNTMINGCIRINDNLAALAYFDEMREAGIAPSKISYTTLMKAFAMNGQPQIAAKIFDEMQKDPSIRIDVVSWNMLIESYSKAGMMEPAKKVFQEMKEKGFLPTVATYGCLVNGFVRAQKAVEALVLWPEIRERTPAKYREGKIQPLMPDAGLLDSLVEICVRAAFFKRALEILACMEELNIPVSKRKYKRLFVELHSNIYTSKHKSRARQEQRAAKKRAAEAFKFWVGLPNEYHKS